jgi:hypothetical protein
MAGINRWWDDAKRQCQDFIQELTLLQNKGIELCLAIVGPLMVWHHLSDGMRIATICHTEMAGQLATLWAAMSSTT